MNNEYKNKLNEELNKSKRLEFIYAMLILSFFAGSISLYLAAYFVDKYVLYIIASILIIPFIFFIIVHNVYKNIVFDINNKLLVISEYEKKIRNNYFLSHDGGEEFMDSNNYFESDLDIFGSSSLYKYISVAATGMGRFKLAARLKDNNDDIEDIKNTQDAVSELSSDFERNVSLISNLKAYSKLNSNNKYLSMENALNNLDIKYNYNKLKLIPMIILELLLIVSIILSILKIIHPAFILLAFIINYMASFYLSTPIKDIRKALIPINDLFYGYDRIIKGITKYDYNSKYLIDIKSSLSQNDIKSLKKFNFLESWITSGNNVLFNIIFNGLFNIDSILCILYSRWQNKYSSGIRNIVDKCADMEVYLSLSTMKFINDDSIIPEISDKFEFKNLRHPLIKDCVGNDFKFDGMNIITGSNMSGKTTFMRTVGISYILFKAGGYVIASSFSAGIYKLFTSMKVVDDTNSGISTFYAEILRIKAIIEYKEKKLPMLVLIDEIFKGTNTLDRVKGATKVIDELNQDYILSIITTHDFELCDTQGVKNYYFMETYNEGEICFDYKIRDGRSKTTNAIYLLKMAGIIKE